MTGLVLFLLVVAAGWIGMAVVSRRAKESERKHEIAKRQAARVVTASIAEQNRKKIDSDLQGWLLRTPAYEGDRDGYVAVSADESELAIYHCSSTRDHAKSDFKRIPVARLRSVELETTTKMGTKVHVDRVPVVTQQKKSAGGRAIIGAIALGPVGAIAGAASGLNKKTTTTYKEVKRTEQVEVAGPKVIVVGTGDLTTPVIRLRCRTDALTEEWAHRLEMLRHVRNQKA